MKHLAVALIVISLIAADFGSDLWMNGTADNHNWAMTDSFALLLAALWFWHHREGEGQ